MRRPYIAGNWKMHKTRAEARELAAGLQERLAGVSHRLLVAPSFTGNSSAAAVQMLKDVGATSVILGHSERRHVYGESDELINTKVHLALEENLDVILCIGETLDEREAGRVDDVNRRQLTGGLAGIGADKLPRITIAYEPVWAIGTGKTATPEDADTVHAAVRKIVADLYSAAAAEEIIIQYGGSVKPDNVQGLMAKENIDGALVGGASLKIDTFVPIATFEK
jgi:triosephosphate isomerase